MKKIYSIILIAIVLASCGNRSEKTIEELISEGNLGAMRTKRTALVTQYDAIAAKLAQLDEAIQELDTVKKLPLVTTFTVKDTLFSHYIELQGNVDTKQNIVINAEFPGSLFHVFVKTGQKVTKGQLLAKIDDGGLSQQVAQMKVQAELAKTTYDRQKRLWEQKIGSEIQYLQAKTAYETQENAVKQLNNQLAKTTVTAPFSGTIDDIFTEQGSVVAPGTRLMRIVNLENMFIEAEVPEKYLTTIKKGSDVNVEFPMLEESITAKVKQVSNYINPNNRSFKIELDIPKTSENIKPNLTSKLKINDYTNPNAILIPQSIISENAEGEQYVYIAENKGNQGKMVAKKIIIKTGQIQGDWVEVIEGIQSGDAVIEEGARSVKDGQEIKIINRT
jgi:membrane fusion protein, multidrug efflux system